MTAGTVFNTSLGEMYAGVVDVSYQLFWPFIRYRNWNNLYNGEENNSLIFNRNVESFKVNVDYLTEHKNVRISKVVLDQSDS